MKNTLLIIRHWIVRQKIHFMRGYGYFGFVGIGYLVSAKLKEQLHEMGIDISMLVVVPIALFGVWLFGYLEIKFEFFHDEMEYYAKNNPSHQNIIKEIRGEK